MAAARKSAPLDRVDPAVLDDIERALQSAGALSLARLTKHKLTPEARRTLESELVARGLERTPKFLRVPLEAQLEALVAAGGRVPRKDLPKRIKGAAKPEIDRALDRLIRAGRLRVVVRTLQEVLVAPAERVLSPTELTQLTKTVAQLSKTLKKAAAKGLPRSLLFDDLTPLLAPFLPLAPSPAPSPALALAPSPALAPLPLASLLEALRSREDPRLKLIRIPDLARDLAARVPLPDLHQALLEASEAGAIELWPEAGTAFLTPEDARLCPPGPRGTVLSYAKLVAR